MHKIKLGVNVDHVATIRQSRLTAYPDPVQAAEQVAAAGADSITVHLREDRRHIQERDVKQLQQKLTIPLNLELAVTDEMLAFAEQVRPQYCCLVPERRAELTTEGGLDVSGQKQNVTQAVQRLQTAGSKVSLFIDADVEQVHAAAETGADMIELHTGQYAEKETDSEREQEIARIKKAMLVAQEQALQINAGHGLNYKNVQLIAAMPELAELNIGHAIIAQAIFSGLTNAVIEMRQLLDAARR